MAQPQRCPHCGEAASPNHRYCPACGEPLPSAGPTARRGDARESAQVAKTVDDYLKAAHDGEPHTVIESVSEGVIFNSLTESMSADYVAVLRPRGLGDAERARAIARAFAHVGKPYDFEFDFFSADRLVCTELLYRAYDGLLNFDLVPIMGRMTLPALEIAKKFQAERGSDDRELDFVMFLDAVPAENRARLATEDDFLATIHRPRAFNE